MGDFVFCNHDTTEQRTYRTKFYEDGLSRESDHELVYTSGISGVRYLVRPIGAGPDDSEDIFCLKIIFETFRALFDQKQALWRVL